ncbi:RNA 2',3'-cyclic phosphodiesterase [Rubrobacter taiwanensis]|uniref:RNA 2',3'-cyclic phosphodiesterase n=1 Tax=Rubrobacter taiwanensis TaxID=185139 RepID=UPI001404E289|nr:RNA 2',3'-cyclic phosphodiesterase [Rubrobacter taiwanensis]
MRLFVAVALPQKLREFLRQAVRELPHRGRVRWTKPENLHLTLKFLGEVPEGSLEEVAAALEEVRRRHAPFEAAVSGLGAFPAPRRARVVWAGISEGAGPLAALAADLDETLHRRTGLEREQREYRAHITLGRPAGRPVSFDPEAISIPERRFRVEGFDLMRSVLKPGGPVYTPLGSFALEGDQGPHGH